MSNYHLLLGGTGKSDDPVSSRILHVKQSNEDTGNKRTGSASGADPVESLEAWISSPKLGSRMDPSGRISDGPALAKARERPDLQATAPAADPH